MDIKALDDHIPSLYRIYQDYFPIGAAVTPEVIKSCGDLITKHFNSITAEDHMKFQNIHPQETVYDFGNADKIVEFAAQNQMKIRGHNLIWHLTPDWLFKDTNGGKVPQELLLKRMEEHIKTVVGRYRDRVYCWDVINEAVDDEESEKMIRDTEWLQVIGEDYIRKAFEWAHEADPKAILFYNDYAAEEPVKRDRIYNLLKSLKERDVPIHAIGMQCQFHLGEVSIEDLKIAIEMYASLGLAIQITELNISFYSQNDWVSRLETPSREKEELFAQTYWDLFGLFREYKREITGVTFWGVSDENSWACRWPFPRNNWPLLFDKNHEPKEAFWAVVKF
jgi:endo-1,4-beta-xylanase